MEIRTVKVLELTEEDVANLKRNDLPILAAGELEAKAEVILFKGCVLKNAYGAIRRR